MWADAQYCVRRCAFLAVCIGMPWWHFCFHKNRNCEKKNHNSIPKLQGNDMIWNNSKLFVIRNCASNFHLSVLPPLTYFGILAPLFVLGNSRYLKLIYMWQYCQILPLYFSVEFIHVYCTQRFLLLLSLNFREDFLSWK